MNETTDESFVNLAGRVATRFAEGLAMAGAECPFLLSDVTKEALQGRFLELWGYTDAVPIWQELPRDDMRKLVDGFALALQMALVKRHSEGFLIREDLEAAAAMHWLDGFLHAHRIANKREAAKLGAIKAE